MQKIFSGKLARYLQSYGQIPAGSWRKAWVSPQHSEKIAMGSSEKFAVLYGNNTLDIKLEAARLMSEALNRPDDADSLISMAIQLFDYANNVQQTRA